MTTQTSVSRRDFLAATATTLGAMALPRARAIGTQPRWQIGCYTRPWDQFDYRVALDGIAEAGFKYAGIMTAKGKSWVIISPNTTPEQAAQIGGEVKQRGLTTASVYGDFKPTNVVAENVKALQHLVERCAECGSPDLLLGGTEDPALAGNYYQSIQACCDFAKTKRVRLTIKPHGGQNATGPQCRKAIEGVGHASFRLWYDPGNIFYYSDGKLDPIDDAATVDGLVVGMSVKDFLPPKEVVVTPGTGRVDFAKVLGRLRAGGFTGGPLIVECLARQDGQDAQQVTATAKRARTFVEELVAQTG